MKTFYINKKANNHINEYTNSDNEHYSDLVSYDKRVASYNHKTNEMSVYGYFSKITATHINDFLEYYGFDRCNKKEIENYI